MVSFNDIRFDCALYNGYKPCAHGNECAGCAHFVEAAPPTTPVPTLPPLPSAGETDSPSILVIKTGAMGDVLRTTTILGTLKRKFPGMKLDWITDPNAVPLLSNNPFIHEVFPFNEDSCRLLESREYDLLINLEKEKAPLHMAGRIQARERFGYAPTPWGTPTIFNPESEYALVLGISDDLKFYKNTKSYPQIICEMVGLQFQRDPYVLVPPAESRVRQQEIEAQLKPRTSRPRIGLNTGCGAVFRTKQWTLDRWVELAGYLQANSNAEILLLGGTAERELNGNILSRTSGLVDTGVDNSLVDFFGIIDCCDVVVTSDSLGMHIAIALGKYVVALFGSTSHTEIDLYDRGEKVITDFPCSPCYKKTCDFNPWCMEAMTGTQVGDAVLRGLSRVWPPAGSDSSSSS